MHVPPAHKLSQSAVESIVPAWQVPEADVLVAGAEDFELALVDDGDLVVLADNEDLLVLAADVNLLVLVALVPPELETAVSVGVTTGTSPVVIDKLARLTG